MIKNFNKFKPFKMKNERGNVLIELALVTPLLILLIAGIVQFGFILNAKIAVNSASYEGVRSATLADEPISAALQAVENYASGSLPGWSFNQRLKARVNIPSTNPGEVISVEVIYTIPVFFSKIPPFSEGSNSFTEISGMSVMKIEEKE